MATTFRTLTSNDIVKSRTRLHEHIPITGSILSGSIYGTRNIKTFSHGLYESVFDYPHISSSANHIMDITYGAWTGSAGSEARPGAVHQVARGDKGRMYQLYSQMLMGFLSDTDLGSGRAAQNYGIQFDEDGNIAGGGAKINECYFINFSRLLVKDEIKKGSFSMSLGTTHEYLSPFSTLMTIADSATATKNRTKSYNASDSYRVNATVGEYGFLYMTGSMVEIGQAVAVDALDTAGVAAAAASDDTKDSAFKINISTAAGGENGDITITLDSNQTTNPAEEGANAIGIGIDNLTDSQIAALIIKAINGTADDRIDFATSGRGQARVGGVIAEQGSTSTKITLTIAAKGTAGNLSNVITRVGTEGVNVVKVASFTGGSTTNHLNTPVGLIFYQPGILVLTSSIFTGNKLRPPALGVPANYSSTVGSLQLTSSNTDSNKVDQMQFATIQNLARGFRNRISKITFNNTVELNSTIYMCRAQLVDYNYSSNPTYLHNESSKLRVKNERSDQPISYVTSIGMYSSDNELLAVAKTSEPLRKDPTSELTMRVRLDY